MALKPTIFKLKVSISDMDRDFYETLNLTIAQHPSETTERMMARLMAFSINAEEELLFSKGLSTPDEPDIWKHGLDGQLLMWIDVGEPAPERIKKATRIAKKVKIYSFNSKSDTWWSIDKKAFNALDAEFYQFPWSQLRRLAELVERTMDLSITISESAAYVAAGRGECEISWSRLDD